MRGKGCGEEPACRGDIPAPGHVDVDDLAVLVHCPVHVPPGTVDLDLRFVDEPPVTHGVTGRAGRVDQLGSEPLHPAEQGHLIHLDAALGQELLQIPVRQAEAQVPADRAMIVGTCPFIRCSTTVLGSR